MRRGFTLVELCVVVAILALLVAVTAVSVRQPLVQAQRGKVIEQVRFLDALARRRCGDSFAPYSMRLKPESGLIWLVDRKGSKLAGAVGLPSGLKLLMSVIVVAIVNFLLRKPAWSTTMSTKRTFTSSVHTEYNSRAYEQLPAPRRTAQESGERRCI